MKSFYGYDAQELGLHVTGYSGHNEVICKCPNPEHNDTNPSASFNLETGLLYCFSCSYSANATQLSSLAGVSLTDKKLTHYVKPDSEQLWKNLEYAPMALDNSYLFKRWVGDLDVIAFDIRQVKQGVVFLFRDLRDRIVGCQIRQYTNHPKYLTFGDRCLFDLRKYKRYDHNKPIVITEGVFGAIRGYQNNLQTLASIGAMIKQESVEFLINYSGGIYGLFDNDFAGYLAGARLLKFIPNAEIICGVTADELTSEQRNNLFKGDYEITNDLLRLAELSGDKKRFIQYTKPPGVKR